MSNLDEWDKAELAKTMPLYEPDRLCPKCYSEDVSTRWDPGHECPPSRPCSTAHPEHFVRTCRRCGFQWIEAVPEQAAAL